MAGGDWLGLLPSFTNGPSQGGVRKVRPTWDWPRPFEQSPPRNFCHQLLSATSVSNFCQLLSREDCGLGPCIGPEGVAWKFESMYWSRPSVEAIKDHPALVPGLPSHLPASTFGETFWCRGAPFGCRGKSSSIPGVPI